MAYSLDGKLVVGISSRALFDLDEADAIFRNQGLDAYRAHQRANEDVVLKPGTGFPLVRGLLAINAKAETRLVEVVVISRNDADSGARVFHSIESHGLDISRGAFTGGQDPWPHLGSFHCQLFLSADPDDVKGALSKGFPAALVCPPPDGMDHELPSEVRIAFDGDAVLFDDESERVYQQQGLQAFQEREAALVDEPMQPGPFKPFLMALKGIQERFPEGESPVRTLLVTARGAPAHQRVINTLRTWGVRIDETFFLGGVVKSDLLESLRPHIYFDDQMRHLERSRRRTPSAQVPPLFEQLSWPVDTSGES